MLTIDSERDSPPNILFQGAKGQGHGAPRAMHSTVTSMYYNTRGMEERDGFWQRIAARHRLHNLKILVAKQHGLQTNSVSEPPPVSFALFSLAPRVPQFYIKKILTREANTPATSLTTWIIFLKMPPSGPSPSACRPR
jgi:hypothetical protein